MTDLKISQLTELSSVDDTSDVLPVVDTSATTTKKITLATILSWLSSVAQTLTNKVIDADNNTITNIDNAEIKASAAIALDKLAATTASRALVSDASGFVTAATTTATEIGHLNGVTSAIQTQLDGKQASGAYITASSADALTNKTIDGNSNTISNLAIGAEVTGASTDLSDTANLARLNSANAFSVGNQSITVANASDVVGLDVTNNDSTNHNPAAHFKASTNGFTEPVIVVETTETGGEAVMDIISGTGTGAKGRFQMKAPNSTGTDVFYGRFRTFVSDNTASSEDSYLLFSCLQGGAETTTLRVGNAINGIHIGTGSAAAIVTSNGNHDLTLQTGNATTGTITITDGANGNITVAPNGTGAVVLNGGLRLKGYTSAAADPTTTELPSDKDCCIHKNTSSGSVFLAFNDGGSTIKKVALT
jgi:hypothetical protein